MVRLADVDDAMRELLEGLALPSISSTLAAAPRPADARVSLISTAGLHRRGDRVFDRGASDYRLIPDGIDHEEIVMSHGSVNFDRSGFMQDVEVAFPLRRLHELAAAGEIGSAGAWHYSFMGATDPTRMVESGHEVGRLLRGDGVTAAVLVPI
jgi:D-proline reductase (dithiol) PrdB